MRWLALASFVFLAGCDVSSPSNIGEKAELADVNSRNALARVASLESKVNDLEAEIASQKRLLDATGASLNESRENHSSLLKTFNANVDNSNAREDKQIKDIEYLLNRR